MTVGQNAEFGLLQGLIKKAPSFIKPAARSAGSALKQPKLLNVPSFNTSAKVAKLPSAPKPPKAPTKMSAGLLNVSKPAKTYTSLGAMRQANAVSKGYLTNVTKKVRFRRNRKHLAMFRRSR